MYFHTDNPVVAKRIGDAIVTAANLKRRIRISVDSDGNIKIKTGEGIWSPPISSTPDPYRDI